MSQLDNPVISFPERKKVEIKNTDNVNKALNTMLSMGLKPSSILDNIEGVKPMQEQSSSFEIVEKSAKDINFDEIIL